MLVIRNEQLEMLEDAHHSAKQVSLQHHLMTTRNMSRDDAHDRAEAVCAVAFELDISEIDHLIRFVDIVELPGWPHLEGRWGAALSTALAHRLCGAEERLNFVERELMPRYRKQLQDGAPS